MTNVFINAKATAESIKPLHGTVNGPVANHDGTGGTVAEFKEMGIPYVRLHDSSFFVNYGGEHTVDISGIFPDFDRDADDEDAYDFFYTDSYIKRCLGTGAKIIYRLGQRIEPHPKKYHVHPPKDFKKWAQICEHIIRHYNEGWNEGFNYGIEYWEIWNEPDNAPACWTGTMEQFYDLFETSAKHLKSCFPNLKIGGPAFAEWSVDNGRVNHFLTEMKHRGVEIDFLSWHTYSRKLEDFQRRSVEVRRLLDTCGYPNAESIIDEWNYLINWKDGLQESRVRLMTMEGAAMASALLCTAEDLPIDKMTYYDARPCGFCGLFKAFTYEKYKTCHAFTLFNKVYNERSRIKAESDDGDVYVLAAKGEKCVGLVTYYTYAANMPEKTVSLHFDDSVKGTAELYVLDEARDAEKIGEAPADKPIEISLKPNSVLYFEIKE
ncbi:MAG: hypothetical protein IJN63_10845 [Clostridia bacterium]|nr:hypothetical protein [Clostridia bacterium]